MKTNYKIGETYYYKGRSFKLINITKHKDYPLICEDLKGKKEYFTLDGGWHINHDLSLSTSPTEFIAPKSDDEWYVEFSKEARDRIIKAYGLNESIMFDCKPIKSCSENQREIKIDNAIQLLKSEGYTITKQY